MISFFFIVFPQGVSRFLVGFVFSYIIISAFILSGRISIKIWTNNFVRFAESNNAGKATYQIVGDSIEFKGSMYECRIPISSIKNILNRNGTYYLKFGNYSGFIVPRLILSGSIEEFIGAIKSNGNFSCEVSK